MTHYSKYLFIASAGLVLNACSAVKPQSQLAGPTYCYGPDSDPANALPFVSLDSVVDKKTSKRLWDGINEEGLAMLLVADEGKLEAQMAFTARIETLGVLTQRGLDKTLSLAAQFCNFDLYEENQCTGAASELVQKAESHDGGLIYQMQMGVLYDHVSFASPDYSDVKIESGLGLSQWSRDPKGVERFSLKGADIETQWIEKPDCSGALSYKEGDRSIDASWTSPETGPLLITYKHCLKGKCYDGTL